jgi:hypothetical protein
MCQCQCTLSISSFLSHEIQVHIKRFRNSVFPQIQDDPAYTTTRMFFCFYFYYFLFFYYGVSAHFWAMASPLPGFQTAEILWVENVSPMPHDQLPTWRVRVPLFVQYFTQNLSSIRGLLTALLPPEKLQRLQNLHF